MTAERYQRNAHHFAHGDCVICGRNARLVTDHCHRHGWIRARICESCNQGLWHAEKRWSLAELVNCLPCGIRHRTEAAHDRCREQYQKKNRKLIEHFLRCPECAAEVAAADAAGTAARAPPARSGRPAP